MPKKKKIANEFEKSTQTYFKEIGEFAPLTKDEEMSLWEKYKKNNDISARDKIIKSNLKFVASVAKPFQGLGLSYSDLIAEGNIGLLKAMDKFDYEKGFKTISYSVWWIRQTIMEALHERNMLNGDNLPADYEKQIDFEGEKEYTNIKPQEQREYEESAFTENFKHDETKDALSILMDILTEREKKVIKKYYGINEKQEFTLEEIGKEIGLTKERVRQIKEKALKKMRAEALKNSITSDIYN